MEITGRVTADATVQTVREDRQVVNFSIAINDSYKPKGSNEYTKVTTYVNCSYWINAKRANALKKGALVQLSGRIGINVYNNMEGKAVGSLVFHTNDFKVLSSPKKTEQTEGVAMPIPQQGSAAAQVDDLPF